MYQSLYLRLPYTGVAPQAVETKLRLRFEFNPQLLNFGIDEAKQRAMFLETHSLASRRPEEVDVDLASDAPPAMVALMHECWVDVPSERPTVPALCARLGAFLADMRTCKIEAQLAQANAATDTATRILRKEKRKREAAEATARRASECAKKEERKREVAEDAAIQAQLSLEQEGRKRVAAEAAAFRAEQTLTEVRDRQDDAVPDNPPPGYTTRAELSAPTPTEERPSASETPCQPENSADAAQICQPHPARTAFFVLGTACFISGLVALLSDSDKCSDDDGHDHNGNNDDRDDDFTDDIGLDCSGAAYLVVGILLLVFASYEFPWRGCRPPNGQGTSADSSVEAASDGARETETSPLLDTA